MKHQISVLFIGLLLLSIFGITLINGLFLEKYYVSKKVEALEEAKVLLSQIIWMIYWNMTQIREKTQKKQKLRFRMRLNGTVPEITLRGSL